MLGGVCKLEAVSCFIVRCSPSLERYLKPKNSRMIDTVFTMLGGIFIHLVAGTCSQVPSGRFFFLAQIDLCEICIYMYTYIVNIVSSPSVLSALQ